TSKESGKIPGIVCGGSGGAQVSVAKVVAGLPFVDDPPLVSNSSYVATSISRRLPPCVYSSAKNSGGSQWSFRASASRVAQLEWKDDQRSRLSTGGWKWSSNGIVTSPFITKTSETFQP